jgi:hypothetical protein
MEALRVNLDISSWNVGTRALAIGAVVTAFLISMHMVGLFSFGSVRPETLWFAMLSVVCPTLFIGFYFQRLGICAAGKIIALIGLPIGILSATLNLIPIMESLSNPHLGYGGLLGSTVFAAVTGAMLSLIASTWVDGISFETASSNPRKREAFLVCLTALIMFCLFSELYANSFDASHRWLTAMTHQWLALFVVSTISLLILCRPSSQQGFLRAIATGCVISMGLGVASATANYFDASYAGDPTLSLAKMGLPIAFSIISIVYSLFAYVVIVIMTLLKTELEPIEFGKMNWHMAEIYVFFVFLTLTPASLWEVLGDWNSDRVKTYDSWQPQYEQLEKRLLELEQREADRLLKSGE